ncbi:MAG: patatin-like phospholipase family protein [Deltaproteobacteria bacterium]|nr:patatin-like phospholipase family protein [Deltaproteobacteria bacterium]
MKKVGIALGGGGAKGLAHIPMLAVLDELGVRPQRIAGTSIGSIMGVLYASGMSAAEMRAGIAQLTESPRTLKELFEAKQLPAWLDFIDIDLGRSSLLKVDSFLDELAGVIGVSTFDQLEIPLEVVAADFWARKERVFDSGPIIPAVAASFALPGIFKPVVMGEQVLVDGGSVNPLPYDLLQAECDIVIAVDVLGKRSPGAELLPSYTESIFNTFQIAEQSILTEKMKASPPSIYVEIGVEDVKVLEFHRAPEIYEQAKPAAEQLRKELAALLA